MNRLFYLLPVAVFAALATLLYVGLNLGPPSALPSPLIGKPAPEMSLPALDGEAQGFSRAELGQGKAVIVNFWSSWCVPCREEHAVLQALASGKSVTLYGVAYKDDAAASRAFLTELGNPFAKIDLDRDGRVAIDWGVTAVPETFVVDAKGIVRVHYAGPLTEDVVQQLILPALAK
jgi:cytochrome c biogenesis protein CcmG/thiol:disulfide interchange protein DsbE